MGGLKNTCEVDLRKREVLTRGLNRFVSNIWEKYDFCVQEKILGLLSSAHKNGRHACMCSVRSKPQMRNIDIGTCNLIQQHYQSLTLTCFNLFFQAKALWSNIPYEWIESMFSHFGNNLNSVKFSNNINRCYSCLILLMTFSVMCTCFLFPRSSSGGTESSCVGGSFRSHNMLSLGMKIYKCFLFQPSIHSSVLNGYILEWCTLIWLVFRLQGA